MEALKGTETYGTKALIALHAQTIKILDCTKGIITYNHQLPADVQTAGMHCIISRNHTVLDDIQTINNYIMKQKQIK